MLLLVALACSGPDGENDPSVGPEGSGLATNGSGPVDLVEEGTALYRRAEFDSVLALTAAGLSEARERGDSATVASLLVLDAYVAYQRSDYERARTLGTRALDLVSSSNPEVRSGPDEGDVLERAYNLLGLIAWQESRFSEAVELFTRTGEVAGDSGAGQTLAAINLGNVHTDLGNLTEAREAFEHGLELSRERGDRRREAIALNNLGMLLVRTGANLEAIDRLEEAVELFREQGASNFEANAIGQLGTAYTALGEIREAIATLDDAVQLAREKGLKQEEASNQEALAEAYRMAGDYRRALRLYSEAERINVDIGLVWEVASDQRSRAQVYEALGDVEGARQAASEALATHRSVGARWEEFADLLLLADLDHQLGDLNESQQLMDEARALAERFSASTARADLALTEATIARRSGRSETVLRVLEAAANDLETSGVDRLWVADVLRAQALLDLGRYEEAAEAGSKAVTAVEYTRSGLASGFLRSRVISDRREAYTTLVQAYLAKGDTAAAFEVSDGARSRALLDHLTISGRDPGRRVEDVARVERRELLARIGEWTTAREYLESFLPEERDVTALTALSDRIAEAMAEYEALRVLAVERDTTRATILGERHATASQIQRTLRPGEVLIEYLVGDASITTFVVTPQKIRSVERSVSSEDLRRRVRIARGLLSELPYDPASVREALGALFDTLLEPAQPELAGAESLVVIPDGVLTYLPFTALVHGTPARYVVEQYAERLLPSASSLTVLRARRSAASHVGGARGEPRLALRGALAFAPQVRELPATRNEVEAFQETVPGSRALIGRSATERRVREALGGGGIVHVATHGVLNLRNPTFSRLDLGPGGDGPEDDGRLEVHELFTMRVRSPLVFLSGCETGLGPSGATPYPAGQDYATLAQAFLYAGAGAVVSTLWRVDDRGAAVMARTFYEELVGGAEPAEALARAQRTLIQEGDYSSPYFWAAYQLTGAP